MSTVTLPSCADDTNIAVPQHGDVRLVPGPNSGRVDVYYSDGQSIGWGTVCGFFWTFDNSEVVCRQLGFDSAASFDYATSLGFEVGTGTIGDFECTGSETHFSNCTRYTPFPFCTHGFDVAVTCQSE